MENFITSFISETEFEKAHAELNERLGLLKQFTVSLDDSQRLGMRTMAEGREGYARTVCRIATTHLECMPRNEDPEQMEKFLAYYESLAGLLQKVALYHEMVDDTLAALGNDIMAMADRYTGYLQTARVGNSNLDMALGQVDTYNKRFGARSSAATPEETN